MRSVIRLSVVATLAIGAVAFETTIAQADGYGAAPRLAPQPYNWSGLYVGGAAGYAWGDGLTDMSVSGVFIQPPHPTSTAVFGAAISASTIRWVLWSLEPRLNG